MTRAHHPVSILAASFSRIVFAVGRSINHHPFRDFSNILLWSVGHTNAAGPGRAVERTACRREKKEGKSSPAEDAWAHALETSPVLSLLLCKEHTHILQGV